MTILDKNDQVALRALFDLDKNDVFQKFMEKLRDEITKKPSIGDSEYSTLLMTITKQAQYDCVNLILEQLNTEIGDIGVEHE